MHPVYVVQQNAKLRIANRRLLIEKDGEDLASIPISHISQVVIFGNVSLTTPAIDTLLSQGIEVVFLSQRGEYRGRLVGPTTPHVPLRRAQYRLLEEPAFSLEMARAFVVAKLNHQRSFLLRHNRDLQDVEISAAIDSLRLSVSTIQRRISHSSLLGAEGSASAAYFRGYRRLFDPGWKFTGRNRRPPRDPVNVLLTLGYTLLTRAAVSAVQTVGLDPYAGFLHEYVYNRPGLALDLVEEFRPVVDGIVLWCLNSGQITPDDFSPGPEDRPVILNETGQRRFLQAYETRLEQRYTHPIRQAQFTLRQCMIEQARQVANCILNGSPDFQGMGFR